MSEVVIRVQNLSKLYRIGAKEQPPRNLRQAARSLMAAPFDYLRRMSRPPTEEETLWALRDVSFDVQRGEVVGIIGRNGAGKSTLLKILSRITEPTEGRAEIYGRVASLLEVGTGFHPELTGRENIYLNGAILGMKRAEIERKFDEIVAFAEIERFLDTPVKRYSSGMYVRLAFAVAAHLEPEILIVDEVLAVGDAQFQKKCLGRMRDVAGEGRTVLFVSHNMVAVNNLCDRAILLNEGHVVCDGQVADVTSRYIAMGAEESGQIVWPDPSNAPGNDRIRLHAVRIVSEGEVRANVDIDADVNIEIEYWNFKPGLQVAVSIHLLDALGSPVFASGNENSGNLAWDEWFNQPHPTGLFRTVCTIPGHFLNNGQYSISAIVLTDVTRTEARVDGTLSFMVHDTGAMRKEYLGQMIGVVRPKLAWQTEYLDGQYF